VLKDQASQQPDSSSRSWFTFSEVTSRDGPPFDFGSEGLINYKTQYEVHIINLVYPHISLDYLQQPGSLHDRQSGARV